MLLLNVLSSSDLKRLTKSSNRFIAPDECRCIRCGVTSIPGFRDITADVYSKISLSIYSNNPLYPSIHFSPFHQPITVPPLITISSSLIKLKSEYTTYLFFLVSPTVISKNSGTNPISFSLG